MSLLRAALTATLLLCAAVAADAGQFFLATDRYVGNIDRLEDLNSDGDALDVGESILWGAGLANAAELATYQSGVLVIDSVAARTYYYEDRNHDGDALDTGESTLWADGFTTPFGIDVANDGTAYLSDFATHSVFRARDVNGDGDALDAGEKVLYADKVPGAVSIQSIASEQYVVAFNSGEVHVLRDSNGDGDALDAGENVPHTPNTITWVEGIAPRTGGGYFVGSWFYDAIYRIVDLNGDGDAFDVGELVSYADNFFGQVGDPWGLAAGPGDELLVANSSAANVIALRDKNHDGDALDLGEIVVFANGIATPVDIVAMSAGLPGDYNNDGFVNALDYTVWRNNLGDTNEAEINHNGDGDGVTESDFNWWKQHYGDSSPGSGGIAADLSLPVPEPSGLMLVCTAIVGYLIVRPPSRRRIVRYP